MLSLKIKYFRDLKQNLNKEMRRRKKRKKKWGEGGKVLRIYLPENKLD